ncbi:MAG: flotillin-like protein FloA [Opitutae bacterium]|nr:flotillin-like protein FloA [Opitutae bacterium]
MNLAVITYTVIIIIALILFFIFLSFFSVWIRALLAGAHVSLQQLITMRLRRVPYALLVDTRITAIKAGIHLSIDEIETHYLAGGDVLQTTQGIINAQKARINLSWNEACAIDLATKGTGKSIIDAVRTSINPKVIDCPNPKSGRTTIDAVAKDGIQVKVRARVTVRSNLARYVGNAQEETVIARVGEGIVTSIGSAESYKNVLENPDAISKRVLERGLDVGTAFEILSIDIADVDVGDNIGAQLQEAQAEANKNMAQAQAEIKRAAAVAREQEMKALVQEKRAEVVAAEAEVPRAMAAALRSGNLGVMDLYRLKNITADTDMRNNLAKRD